jgi:formyl-CoA transferase
MDHFLQDLVVVDAATFLAGPGAATMLGDFGATVIKIEPPSGDGYRGLVGRYPVPYHWLLTSRNKQSLAVDLRKDAGQQLFHEVIAKADVMTYELYAQSVAALQHDLSDAKCGKPAFGVRAYHRLWR